MENGRDAVGSPRLHEAVPLVTGVLAQGEWSSREKDSGLCCDADALAVRGRGR